MDDRRRFPRKTVDVFLNKFIGGYPHLCRAVDISAGGMQLVGFHEPVTHMESFPLELRLPGDSHTMWLWARRISARGRRQVLEFVNPSAEDSHRLERFIESYAVA
ncbi:MAG: PilZ domain-containing protein [Myxococcales bacterium]|nr:PilZ domain-containing protein [Myxococcales bacterium]